MLWLSGATGQEVVDVDGTVLGRVIDLTVRLGSDRPTPFVSRLLVALDHGGCTLLERADAVVSGPDRVEVASRWRPTRFATDRVSDHLADDELLLRRDVLDTQIVDVVGHRLARVADVALVRTDDGHLEVLAVEIGFGRVLARIGLHRLSRVIPDGSIAWTDLHLTSDRGHLVQLSSPASAVHRLSDADLAELVSRLDVDAATEVLTVAGASRSAGAIRHAHPAVAERLLRAMTEPYRIAVLAHMPVEHAGRWRSRMSRVHPLRGRRFLRGAGWRHRHAGASGDR